MAGDVAELATHLGFDRHFSFFSLPNLPELLLVGWERPLCARRAR
jgi:hypothetical protein